MRNGVVLGIGEIEALDGARLADQLVRAVRNEKWILQSIRLSPPCSDLMIDQPLKSAVARAST